LELPCEKIVKLFKRHIEKPQPLNKTHPPPPKNEKFGNVVTLRIVFRTTM